MQFASEITWRTSQRGLVVCGPGGEPLLIEHPLAARLPELLTAAEDVDDVAAKLGGSEADRTLVADLVAEQIITADVHSGESLGGSTRRVTVTRSGIEFTGIDVVARALHKIVMPVVSSRIGRIAIGAVLVAGVVALLVGRPDGPQVSDRPWVDATVGLLLALAMAALHELAHAVALVHYGRTPRRAGCGFYWGALCFYVDSSDGITLPRRARIINALAGLAVDLFTTAVLLIVAHGFAGTVLISAVCWRIAILQLVGIAECGLPILEVDGQVALSDYLDEPDLSPRSREALSRKLRRIHHDDQPSWLATYGAFSLIAGIVLMAGSAYVWWLAAGDLIRSLFAGNPGEVLLGLYVVVPVAVGVLFSTVGLVLEVLAKPQGEQADRALVD